MVEARADFVAALDQSRRAHWARQRCATRRAWIFAAATNPVREVWAGGRRVVVVDGRHVARDRVRRGGRLCSPRSQVEACQFYEKLLMPEFYAGMRCRSKGLLTSAPPWREHYV